MLNFLLKLLIFIIITRINFINAQNAKVTNPLWNATNLDNLKRDLLLTYDRFAKPNELYNLTTIKFGLSVIHIDLNEERSMLDVLGWIKMEWNDEKLKWNPKDYGGLDVIRLASHEIWQPDIVLYNSATYDLDHYGKTNCLVRNNGQVLWVPPSQLQSLCSVDLRFWPFDMQKCMLKFGSWTHDGYQLDVVPQDNKVDIDNVIENHEWQIMETSAQRSVRVYPCCEEPYVDVQFNITIKRRSPMYKAIVVTPASMIILMTLANFWLPPQSGEKILLNGINTLIITFMLLFFAQKLPVMALHTPLIVLFYSTTLYLTSFSMILSVIVINLSRSKQSHGIPRVLKKILDGSLGTILGLKRLSIKQPGQQRSEELRDNSTPFEEHGTSDDHQIIETVNKGPIQQDWILLATAIDRIAFIIYCIVFTLLAAIYSV